MEILELFLILIVAVLASALIDRRLPRVAAPIVQIVIGFIMALLLPISPVIEADPELFLLLFIAPLLFYESRELDKTALWNNKVPILSLAIGLVIVMMILVGIVLHLLLPEVPIALCFAVGAALGPTDAAAVVALAGSVKFPKRIDGVLGAEAIFNDATGVVAFQFALAAAISGMFEPSAAILAFIVEFLGGLLLGVVLGALGNWVTTIIRNQGMTSVTFHVLFEIAMPFLSFIIGQAIGVSGVLAAVACGLVFDLRGNGTGADVSKTKIVSAGIWKVATFALNGIVFVLLGLQLPSGFEAIVSAEIDTFLGFSAVIAVLATVVVFRFIWCLFLVKISERPWGDNNADIGLLRSTALLTFGGAKGAITMSAILMIPTSFVTRNALVFIASCVIIATLVLANIIMPKLVPQSQPDEKKNFDEERLNILRKVMTLIPDAGKDMSPLAVDKVMGEYRERIIHVTGNAKTDSESRELRLAAIQWERERLKELSNDENYDSNDISKMSSYLDRKEEYYSEHGNWRLNLALAWKNISSQTISWAEIIMTSLGVVQKRNTEKDIQDYSALKNECSLYAIKKLKELPTDDTTEISERISSLIIDYRLDMAMTLAYTPQIEDVAKINSQAAKLRVEAFNIEADAIESALDNNIIDNSTAKAMKRTLAMLHFDAEEMI